MATLASWAKVVKWMQSLQLQFKAYQRLNLNKKEKRPLCIEREGRARLRSSTSVCACTHIHTHTHTPIHSLGKHIYWHQNTNIKGHADNHIKTHSKSHKSADTQLYKKKQTSFYTHTHRDIIKRIHTHTHTHGRSPVSLAGQLWEVTQTWQFCYQASIKACRFKHSLLKSHQSQTLGSLISHLPFNTAVPTFHSALLFMLTALNSAF